MLNSETKLKLIKEVTFELKDILTVPEDLQIGDCNSTSYLGMCYIDEKRITISNYVSTEQDYKDVLAHELLHLICNNHKKEFKEYCDKINNLGLGYNVQTTAKSISNVDEIRKIRREKRAERKSYVVWCPYCGWNRIYKIKRSNISGYSCPKCRHKLKQKQWKPGTTISWGRCYL